MTPDALLYRQWAKTRDSEAFRELIERHLDMVYSTAHRMLANREDAEDITLECFEKLAIANTSIRENLAGWLYRSAANRAIDRIRSDGARKARERRYAEQPRHALDSSWEDIRAQVDEAIAGLPADLRSAIVLHYFEGHTHQAAAEKLGVSPNTVMKRLKSGIEEIRRQLRRKGVAVAAPSLAAALGALESEAAPVSVAASLNKIVLAGWIGSGTTAQAAWLATGFLAMKKVVLGTAAALALIALGYGRYTWQKESAEVSPPVMQVKDRRPQHPATPTAERSVYSLPINEPPPMPVATVEPLPLAPGKARVEGVLLGAQGKPLATYIVKGIRLEGGNGYNPASSVTDSSGGFLLNDLAPGSYWLFTTGAKSPPQQIAPTGQETVITLRADEVKKGIVLRLNDGLGIAGRILDEKGIPVASAGVAISPVAPSALREQVPILSMIAEETQGQLDARLNLNRLQTKSTPDGGFRFLGLADAEYILTAAQTSYRQTSLRVRSGEEKLEIVLEKLQIAISGQVIDAFTRRPLGKFEVGYGPGWKGRSGGISNDIEMTTVSDPQGRFSFTADAPFNAGFVIASAKGYAQDAVDIRPFMTEYAKAVDVIVPLKPSRKVRGRVVNDAGKEIADAHIFLGYAPNANISSYARSAIGATNASGKFEVEIASAEKTIISAAKQEYTGKNTLRYVGDEVAIPSGNEDVEGITLTLSESGASITGYLSLDGELLPRVRVYVRSSDDQYSSVIGIYDGMSDDTGFYTVEGLPSMPCTINVSSTICPGFGPYEPPTGQPYISVGMMRNVILERGQRQETDLDFLGGNAELTGSIRLFGAEAFEPIAIGIEVMQPDGAIQYYLLETDEYGLFHAGGLPAGEAKWSVYHKDNHWEGSLRLEQSVSMPLELDLDEKDALQ
ncbi:MAG TPA: sigma-70 family RNA polymerase sigma factor [Candidatus Bathyarchaeia archaeon]|nr:sigma-70 family RNA polymerase sigma factor [Candidatus Bathyarchaeia archaeon]